LAHDHGEVKVAVEEVEACKRKLAVEAPADVVQQEWERAYGRVQRQARLPGFRKGHVPRSLVKLHFADDVRREVAEHLIPDVYRRAVSDAKLDPVNEPDLQDVRLEEGAPLSFTAVVEIKPTITLGEYKGLDIEHTAQAVTDADVDETLEQMREQHAQFQSVDRSANPGDLVVVDYTLTPEGQEPHTQTGYAFLTGSGTVLPEIDQAVIGMRGGEEREVGVRFADDHRTEALRGRSGKASVRVVEVKEKILPVVDDEFARTLGDFETVAAVREEIKKELAAQRTRQERQGLEEKIVEALLARHEFAVPRSMTLRHISHQVEHARERMRRQGLDPDATQWDVGKIVTELTPGAEKAVRRSLLLEAIATQEGLTPAETDVDAEIEKLARASQRPAPAVRRMMEKSGDLEGLRHGLRERMTFDFLVQHASIRG
jgi:trigger factor